MRAIVLGSAAGGGFPQWNCGCPNCVAVREGRPGYRPRTQDSLAVTEDGSKFVIVNASPEILAQVQRTPQLWPRTPRSSPISAIIVTNGDMDHVLGLFSLRESWPLALYVTTSVRRGLEESAFIRTLQRFEGQLVIREIFPGSPFEIADAAGEGLGICARPFSTKGKLPVHFMGRAKESREDNIGLSLYASARTSARIAYAAACGSADDLPVEDHDVVLFDGTFFREDELVRLGLSTSMARDMAHVPIDGENGSLARLSSLTGRKIYTHINNTNPILAPGSDERRRVEACGWEVAFDGMEIALEEAR